MYARQFRCRCWCDILNVNSFKSKHLLAGLLPPVRQWRRKAILFEAPRVHSVNSVTGIWHRLEWQSTPNGKMVPLARREGIRCRAGPTADETSGTGLSLTQAISFCARRGSEFGKKATCDQAYTWQIGSEIQGLLGHNKVHLGAPSWCGCGRWLWRRRRFWDRRRGRAGCWRRSQRDSAFGPHSAPCRLSIVLSLS